jgi:hypothetical protein
MAFDQTRLRSWIRQVPHPVKLRLRTVDDDEKTVVISDNPRTRWRMAEQAVKSSQAKNVECLDKNGDVLRAISLTDDDSDGGGDYEDKRAKNRSAEIREIAAIIDRAGARQNEAFDRGAAAASAAQENLISIVETLTINLTAAITNLHNVSVNFANMLAGSDNAEPLDKNTQLVGGILGQLLQRNMAASAAAASDPPNGGKRK